MLLSIGARREEGGRGEGGGGGGNPASSERPIDSTRRSTRHRMDQQRCFCLGRERSRGKGGRGGGGGGGGADRGAICHEAIQSGLHSALRTGVQGCRGLIQQQQPGVTQNCSRDGHPLFLATAHSAALLTHHCVIPALTKGNESVLSDAQLLLVPVTHGTTLHTHPAGSYRHTCMSRMCLNAPNSLKSSICTINLAV